MKGLYPSHITIKPPSHFLRRFLKANNDDGESADDDSLPPSKRPRLSSSSSTWTYLPLSSLHISLHLTPFFLPFTSVTPFKMSLQKLNLERKAITITSEFKVFKSDDKEWLVAIVDGFKEIQEELDGLVGRYKGPTSTDYECHLSVAYRDLDLEGKREGEEEEINEDDYEPVEFEVKEIEFKAGDKEYNVDLK